MKSSPRLQALPPVASPETNHHRQVFWQVWVPFSASILVFMALGVLIVLSAAQANPNLTRWSNMSAMWIIMLMVPPGLMLLLLLAAFIYLTSRLQRILPAYAHLAQAYMAYFAALVRYWLDRMVKPVLAVNGFFASWQALNKRIFKH
jgi:small-conductance mechanosensitive channel